MALLNFSLPFHGANFAPEPFFNIPPPQIIPPSTVPPPHLPSAAEINSLYSPPSQQQPQRRQAPYPTRTRPSSTNPYRSSSYSSASASASVQSYNRPPSSSRGYASRPQKGKSSSTTTTSTIPPPPQTPLPKFSEKSDGKGSHTLHAVIDYDDYDEVLTSDIPGHHDNTDGVTPIQGPILLKNGSVPVVPLYSYPVLSNGSLVQIPIMWTALSLALGLEIRGEIIRGVPCIKRFHQLFCPTAGNSYPIDRIERFIDENKALMKRMYGEFQMTPDYGTPPSSSSSSSSRGPGPELYETKRRNVKREAGGGPGGTDVPPSAAHQGPPGTGDSYFASQTRHARQSSSSVTSGPSSSSSSASNAPFRNNQSSESGRLDACESKVEIVTPYWASNSAGKIRAIVNTQHFEQAIHQEVCSKVQTKRCSNDCGCEQKYKWHRLLAYDPDNDCKGIFMDWFLFPSCCVCRCAPFDGK